MSALLGVDRNLEGGGSFGLAKTMALPDLSPFSLEYKEPAKPQLTTRICTQQEKLDVNAQNGSI